VERRLALMAGAGVLPGRAAAEAARQGWRVVALAFDDAAGLAEHAERVIPCSLTDLQGVLRALGEARVSAAIFVGKLWKREVFSQVAAADALGRHIARSGLSDEALTGMVLATLDGIGVEALDPRGFLDPWMAAAGTITARAPSSDEWAEIQAGFRLARHLAAHGIGQSVVRSRGVTLAVEAAEGTDETIRRGMSLAGPGAVVIKAVAANHDFRFDIPTIGPATLEVMAAGGATALAVEEGKVLIVDREATVRLAERAGITIVSSDGQV
jgi:UDP-2,3-diacylglucosamine hydrolase